MKEKIINYINNKQLSRERIIKDASFVGIIANVIFAITKISIGLVSNSISIISDAVNNASDALSSIITLVGLKISQKPPNKRHPLGYGRIEYVTSLIISAMILITGYELLQSSIDRIINPTITTYNSIQLVVLSFTIIGKILLSRLTIILGESAQSDPVIASGTDAKVDAIITTFTLISAIIVKITGIKLDGYIGVVLSLFVVYTAYQLIRNTVDNIIGKRPSKKLADKIRNEVVKYKPIMGGYDLILHNYGPSNKLGTINVEIPDYENVEDAYEAMSKAQEAIIDKYGIFLTFGLYSVNTYDKDILKKKESIRQLVCAVPQAISIHNFTYEKDRNLIRFDVIVDFNVKNYENFKEYLIKIIREEHPNLDIIINIDPDYS